MNRIQRLINDLPDIYDAALITTVTNREYMTRFLSSDGALLVFKNDAYFIIDSRYYEAAKSTVQGAEVILQGRLFEQIKELCAKHDAHKVAVEREVSLAQYSSLEEAIPEIEFCTGKELSELVHRYRAVKDKEEIELIRDAQKITDAAFLEILNFIRPGVTEKQVAAELEYYMRRNGADGVAFETIVASGENGSKPHAVPGERKIKKGDLVTMDFGAKLNGYCSDMTRTVAVGNITQEQLKVYNTVLEAHLTSMKAAHAGCSSKGLDKIARDIIYNAGYEGCFGHSLGHSLGLDIHEAPGCSPNSDYVLEENTVMTIEPGIYIEGKMGVRIENMILITKDGFENLTGSERALITLN